MLLVKRIIEIMCAKIIKISLNLLKLFRKSVGFFSGLGVFMHNSRETAYSCNAEFM